MRKKWLAFAAVLCMGSAVTVCAAETDNAAQIVSETEQGSDIVQNVDAQEQTDDTIQEDVTQEDGIEGQTNDTTQETSTEEQANDTTQETSTEGQVDETAENTDYPTATLTLVWHFGEWGRTTANYFDTSKYAEDGSLVMDTKTITLDRQDENGNYYFDGEAIRFNYEIDNYMYYFPFFGQDYTYNGETYYSGFRTENGGGEFIADRALEYTTIEGDKQLLRGVSRNKHASDEEVFISPIWYDTNLGTAYYGLANGPGNTAGWIIKTYGDAVCHVYFTRNKNISTDVPDDNDDSVDTGNDSTTEENSYGGTGIVRGTSINFPMRGIDETALNDAQKSSIQEYKEAMEKLTGVNPAYCTEFELVDIHKPDGVTDEELAEGIDITFPVWWIAPSDKIIVLHLKSDGVWELLPATAGDGKITATFTSLSPVMITKVSEEAATDGTEQGTHIHSYFDQVVAPTADTWGYTLHTCECGAQYIDTYVAPVGTGQAAASTDLISPKTGETGVPRAVACAMLAAIGAVTIAAGYKARAGHR